MLSYSTLLHAYSIFITQSQNREHYRITDSLRKNSKIHVSCETILNQKVWYSTYWSVWNSATTVTANVNNIQNQFFFSIRCILKGTICSLDSATLLMYLTRLNLSRKLAFRILDGLGYSVYRFNMNMLAEPFIMLSLYSNLMTAYLERGYIKKWETWSKRYLKILVHNFSPIWTETVSKTI